jgi:uncharacterized membrane protein
MGHPWWMMALCLIPMLAIVAVTVFQLPLSNVLLFGMVLLCPLMHVFMMRGMGQDHGGRSQEPTTREQTWR